MYLYLSMIVLHSLWIHSVINVSCCGGNKMCDILQNNWLEQFQVTKKKIINHHFLFLVQYKQPYCTRNWTAMSMLFISIL